MSSLVRVSFRFNRKENRLARWQLAREVESLPLGSILLITCNMQPEHLGLLSFPTTDESAWFRKDIQYFWLSDFDSPREWAEEWKSQEDYLRRTNA